MNFSTNISNYCCHAFICCAKWFTTMNNLMLIEKSNHFSYKFAHWSFTSDFPFEININEWQILQAIALLSYNYLIWYNLCCHIIMTTTLCNFISQKDEDYFYHWLSFWMQHVFSWEIKVQQNVQDVLWAELEIKTREIWLQFSIFVHILFIFYLNTFLIIFLQWTTSNSLPGTWKCLKKETI